MRHLYLLRHAKSSWADSSRDDFDRALAPRGVMACKAMKAHLKRTGIMPDLVLCSPAERARATYELIASAFGDDTEVRFENGLYEVGSQALLKRLRRVHADVGAAMMIGHNTGIEHLALALTSGTETKSLARMRAKFPTLGLASIEIRKGAWPKLGPGSARLKDFVVPRDLEKAKRKK